MIAIRVFLILLAVGVPVLLVLRYLAARRRKTGERDIADEMLQQIVEPAIRALERNVDMLRDGDIGWRALAKGESGIALALVVPASNSERGEHFERFTEEFPETVATMERNDRRVRRVRIAAASLAASLETPTKRQFEQDRERVRDDPQGAAAYGDTLLAYEETWMVLLRTIINDGKFIPERFARQYGAYWTARGSVYLQLRTDHAAKEHREFERTKTELYRKSLELKEMLRKVSLKLQARREAGAPRNVPVRQ